MGVRIVLSSVIGLGLLGPALAGPCTQRLAELEKSVTARQEGAGPALADPAPAGSRSSSDQAHQPPAPVAAQAAGGNNAMRMIQEAKELDRQGKEAECMALVTKIAPAIPATK